jgi:uncharacterized LabA/DUF88 family protein
VVYVDGYNLYYGLLRRTKLKWLDLFALFRDHVLGSEAELLQVRYYTAPVLGKMCDSADSPQRQRIYLQALCKMYAQKIAIIQGKIIASTPYLRLVRSIPGSPVGERVQVYDFNEKKTDVNLAADLIAGAWVGDYEQAVLCSNDTDLEAALATVRRYHPQVRLGVVAPIPGDDHRRIAADLSRHAHWSKSISVLHLECAQLPARIPNSSLCRPLSW